MLLHTVDRPYKCEQCSLAFIQSSDQMRHKAVHSKSFDCPKGEMRFKTQKSLHCHQLTHIQDIVVEWKSFKDEAMLKYQEGLHVTKVHLTSDLCGETFSTRNNLESHIKAHPTEQPFGCNLCKVTFKTIERMGLHFREYHGVGKSLIWNSCSSCQTSLRE